jgi:Gpi18-like mannosyltransferase
MMPIKLTLAVLFSVISGEDFAPPYQEIISAVLLSNACHFASTIVLYKLTLLCSNSRRSKELAWLASALHVLSPAGLFLSAPYSESLFSFLSFAGSYLYQRSSIAMQSGHYLSGNAFVLCSAIVFSTACTVRSNGLLNGVLFLFDFASELNSFRERLRVQSLIRVFVLGIGGLLLGSGVILPQYIAWKEFCTSDMLTRPWCTKLIPSIYTYVQDFYWLDTTQPLPSPRLAIIDFYKTGTWVCSDTGRFQIFPFSCWRVLRSLCYLSPECGAYSKENWFPAPGWFLDWPLHSCSLQAWHSSDTMCR